MKEDFLRGLGFSRKWSQISLFQLFHFPEILRTGLALRQNERNLESATFELGEFASLRKKQGSLDEGEQVEWELLKGRVLRFREERSRLLKRSDASDLLEKEEVGEKEREP